MDVFGLLALAIEDPEPVDRGGLLEGVYDCRVVSSHRGSLAHRRSAHRSTRRPHWSPRDVCADEPLERRTVTLQAGVQCRISYSQRPRVYPIAHGPAIAVFPPERQRADIR
jgi:hypothetical protein